MEHHSQSNGLGTFLEHSWFLLTVILALLTSQVLMFFMGLKGTTWICFFVVSLALMVIGAGLIGYAKFPLYRCGRFLTFGPKSIPEKVLRFYCWGWRVFVFGVVLGLCLLLSR